MQDVVEFEHSPEGFIIHTGHPLLGDIHADFRKVGPDQRLGTARTLLVSAALDCYCGTLNMALAARDVRYRCIRGRGWADKEQKNGTSFITKVTIEVHAEVDPEDEKILAHCLDIVKGCMITRSLTHGMEVDIRQI